MKLFTISTYLWQHLDQFGKKKQLRRLKKVKFKKKKLTQENVVYVKLYCL